MYSQNCTAVLACHYKPRATLTVVLHMFCYFCIFCIRSSIETRKVTFLNRCVRIYDVHNVHNL